MSVLYCVHYSFDRHLANVAWAVGGILPTQYGHCTVRLLHPDLCTTRNRKKITQMVMLKVISNTRQFGRNSFKNAKTLVSQGHLSLASYTAAVSCVQPT